MKTATISELHLMSDPALASFGVDLGNRVVELLTQKVEVNYLNKTITLFMMENVDLATMRWALDRDNLPSHIAVANYDRFGKVLFTQWIDKAKLIEHIHISDHAETSIVHHRLVFQSENLGVQFGDGHG